MTNQTTRRPFRGMWVVALFAVLSLVAAACGDDDGDDVAADGGGDGGETPTLGVLSGAVEDGYAVDIGVPEEQISRFDTTADMVDALQAGRIDAFALTAITVREQVEDAEGLVATEGFVPVIDGEEQLGCGGYVFRFDDKALRDEFNEVLSEMQADDELLPLVEEFGFSEDELDPAVDETVETLTGEPYDAAMEGEGDPDALERAREEGVRLGFASEPPYGYIDQDTGEPTGQAPTVAMEVLERMDIEVTDSSVVDFGALINGLNADQYDVIAAGMFINEERTSQALFTDPDYCATTAFAVPDDSGYDIETFEDFIPEDA